jgi:hypothetical protein
MSTEFDLQQCPHAECGCDYEMFCPACTPQHIEEEACPLCAGSGYVWLWWQEHSACTHGPACGDCGTWTTTPFCPCCEPHR